MRFFLCIVVSFFWSTAAFAQAESIKGVIGNQLEAFNERDVDDAWQYASPTIQGLFGTSRNFGAMVENGYPMVWTNQDVEFLEQSQEEGRTLQRVLIRDTEGTAHILEYAMVETPEGWRIDGVQLLQTPEVAA